MGKKLDGSAVAEKIADSIYKEYENSVYAKNKEPLTRLTVVQVGNNPASESYIRSKEKLFKKAGAEVNVVKTSDNAKGGEVISTIKALAPYSDGMIVQLPLPESLKEHEEIILKNIPIEKDVDGFFNKNLIPCTPLGVLNLLKYYKINVSGKSVTIIGRGKETGLPLARILSSNEYNATVTLCNSYTENLNMHIKNADIIISAVGKPEFITSDMIKEGAVCIDIGINSVEDSSKKSGYRICGDFKIDDALIEKCGAYTPTPGGTGPMTVAALLENTLIADGYGRDLITKILFEGEKNG